MLASIANLGNCRFEFLFRWDLVRKNNALCLKRERLIFLLFGAEIETF